MHGFLARLVSNDMRVDGLFFILPRTSSADKLFTGGECILRSFNVIRLV